MVKALAAMPADALKLVTMSTEPNSTSTLRAVELAAYVLSAAWALSRRRRSATAREVCLMVGGLTIASNATVDIINNFNAAALITADNALYNRKASYYQAFSSVPSAWAWSTLVVK